MENLKNTKHDIHRKRDKNLGIFELVAIALGGMIGGGIFSVVMVLILYYEYTIQLNSSIL